MLTLTPATADVIEQKNINIAMNIERILGDSFGAICAQRDRLQE
jgi:hypothetical protein